MRTLNRYVLPLFALATLLPWVSGALSLVTGVAVALILGNPYLSTTKSLVPRLLALSIIGLGAGMNLEVIGRVGLQGVGITLIGITATMGLGMFIAKMMRIPRETGLLISAGTAICGGSAIAAVAATIHAKNENTSIALAIVFLLNALALVMFPAIGHYWGLNETQFGFWSALAIHDTSSVVGAAMKYGNQALQIATTIKLARALWIVPLVLGIRMAYRGEDMNSSKAKTKAKRPWFILGFLLAAALMTWVPVLQPVGNILAAVAKRLLILTLFLIGTGLTKASFKEVGVRPFMQGALLWIVVASATLLAIIKIPAVLPQTPVGVTAVVLK